MGWYDVILWLTTCGGAAFVAYARGRADEYDQWMAQIEKQGLKRVDD
jgi:hypothetical protein